MPYNYEIDGDRIQFGKNNNTSIDINALWQKHKQDAKPFVLEPSWYQITLVQIGLTTVVSLMVFMFSFLYFKRRKLARIKKTIPDEIISPLTKKLFASSKTTFDIDELDEFLEISHMEFDSRKLKRHRLLSDLEKSHPGLIQRQKDETDKRRFIYEIHKKQDK